MEQIFKLIHFLRPCWKRSLAALVLLTSLVFLDLSIPRLIQRIIDQGITANNQQVVTQTALLMIGSFILMINTSRDLALSLLPLLLVTSIIIIFFILKMEPLCLRY